MERSLGGCRRRLCLAPRLWIQLLPLTCRQGTHVPEQKVKLRHGDQLLVNGLPDNIRLDYLRCGWKEAGKAIARCRQHGLRIGGCPGSACWPRALHWAHPTLPCHPTRSAYLGEAFQAHLQSNELLHQVFQFQPAYEPEERLTPLEKRLFKSKSSGDVRDRTELRRRERSQMASYKHGSLAAD